MFIGGSAVPKVAYSEEDRAHVRETLITAGLKLVAEQGVQHTTVEQICKAAGISRTFFYSFFSAKEDLVVEALYLQQPNLLAFARSLMEDPSLSWREGVERFLCACCYGEKNGIAVLTIEEQQRIFRRLSPESYQTFRSRQERLFASLLECFGIRPNRERIGLFTNICLALIVIRRAIPDTLPLFVPEAADAAVRFQIRAITDELESQRES